MRQTVACPGFHLCLWTMVLLMAGCASQLTAQDDDDSGGAPPDDDAADDDVADDDVADDDVAESDGLVHPAEDLRYLGAFRFPTTVEGYGWGYSTQGMSYLPHGDPSGPEDGHPGSLFAITNTWSDINHAGEISIPEPSTAADVESLPAAEMLQPLTDVTAGTQVGGSGDTQLADVQYLPAQEGQSADTLYWAMWDYYSPDYDDLAFGWCGLDFDELDSHGSWRLDDYPFSATGKYLFEIPASWADEHVDSKYLAAGRFRVVNSGSFGPALYAFAPWQENGGQPPADGSALETVQLLYYPDLDHKIDNWSSFDGFHDGVWLTSGARSAVVLTGNKALRTWDSDQQYYGVPDQDQCGGKGYHAAPYVAAMYFYDPADLAAVAAGDMEPYEPQPYAVFNVDDVVFNRTCHADVLGGAAFDREHGLLYVAEMLVDGVYNPRPIVHVWSLDEEAHAADLTAPATPMALEVSAVGHDQVDLDWEDSSDDVRLVGYIVYRYGEPIDTVLESEYSDQVVNPEGIYEYSVVAWDAASNRSETVSLAGVETPSGSDGRSPIVHDVVVDGITTNNAVLHWDTDELADTYVEYWIEYVDEDNPLVLHDPALTRAHQVPLQGLSGGQKYIFYISATDATGNILEYHRKYFTTL